MALSGSWRYHRLWTSSSICGLKSCSPANVLQSSSLIQSDSSSLKQIVRKRHSWLSSASDSQSLRLQSNLKPCVFQARNLCTPAVEKETQRLFSCVAVEVRGSDEAVLDSYCQFVSRAAAVLNFDISGKIVLPTHFEKHTLLKSPHIYKKHRAQYEIRTYKRMLQLRDLTGSSADTFLEYIQRNLPEGVSMIVEQTELQPLPEFIKGGKVKAESRFHET